LQYFLKPFPKYVLKVSESLQKRFQIDRKWISDQHLYEEGNSMSFFRTWF
jgi:hypothetical protein